MEKVKTGRSIRTLNKGIPNVHEDVSKQVIVTIMLSGRIGIRHNIRHNL